MARKFSNLPYLLAAVAGLTIVVLAFVLRDHPAFQPVVLGSRAPAFTAMDLTGTPRSLADYGDKVILLNIWATWCPPCIEELPSMQRMYEALAGEPFEIVAVSVDATLGTPDPTGMIGGDVGAFVRSFGLTFPVLHDPQGTIRGTFKTTGVPESFIIGRDGIVYYKAPGPRDWDHPEFLSMVRRLIAEGS